MCIASLISHLEPCLCVCVAHVCVFVSLCPSPPCTKMYKSNTSALLPHLLLLFGGFKSGLLVCVCLCTFHLPFSSKGLVLLLSWFFSFASVCKTPNSCDWAKIKQTLKMSVTLQFITLCPDLLIKGPANTRPSSLALSFSLYLFLSFSLSFSRSREASSPPCVCDKQGIEDYRGCGEEGKNPKLIKCI